MKRVIDLVSVVCAMGLSSCAVAQGGTLQGTAWQMDTVGSSPLPPGNDLTLIFAATTVSGTGNGNTFRGTYSANGSRLTIYFGGIGPFSSSQLDQNFAVYLGNIQRTASYTASANRLTLYNGPLSLATFVAAPLPTPTRTATLPPASATSAQAGIAVPTANLMDVDICNRMPEDKLVHAMGRKLLNKKALAPSALFGSGCQYDFGLGDDGKSYYVDLFVAPESVFANLQSISASVTPLTGIGDAAYTAIRPDGPMLWVLVKGKGALGVAIGGSWSVDKAQLLASYLIDLLASLS
jgi:heat shock protein HslJ